MLEILHLAFFGVSLTKGYHENDDWLYVIVPVAFLVFISIIICSYLLNKDESGGEVIDYAKLIDEGFLHLLVSIMYSGDLISMLILDPGPKLIRIYLTLVALSYIMRMTKTIMDAKEYVREISISVLFKFKIK